MNIKYLILVFIVIALGIGMLFMSEKANENQGQPEMLLAAIDDPSRFLSTDEIADRLVKKDPSLMLIDVRPPSQFKAFALPRAVNIPVDSLFTAYAQDMLEREGMDKVFYSNADVTSDQVWIICKRLELPQIYVMEGGVNKWFNDIVKAAKPAETASSKEMEKYHFRMAVRQHFFGSAETKTDAVATPKKVIKVTKKPAPAASEEGC